MRDQHCYEVALLFTYHSQADNNKFEFMPQEDGKRETQE